MYSPPMQGQGQTGEGRDVIALRGTREDIIYRGHGTMPGRIGSALSLPLSEVSHYDDDDDDPVLHHDDIVEHLDVIGAR